jgi:glycosyltransferase involved in cell wall biosynthesis
MEIRNELGIPPHVPVLIATGSFKAQKGHRMLIRAFSRMKNSECILLLLGSGPLEEECRRLVDFHGLRNRIRFIGTVENVCDYLNASDIFVLSSHWEGFGLAVVEAAMARIPVVATAVDGVTEIVENQETAFLCCPETEALAARLDDALVCMVRDPGAVAVMCDKAYRRAREVFSFERMAGKILSLYQEVIANKAVSP